MKKLLYILIAILFCAQCELLRFCRGCPAVAFGYTHNFYAPDPQCWKEV